MEKILQINTMEYFEIIGLTAGVCTTISFLPQAIKVYKTKHTKDLSLLMFIILLLGVTLWLIYGLTIKDTPLIAANTVTFILALYILGMKIKHG